GPDLDTNDALPVNCITWEAARRACQLASGDLPSEAQWEHAARGRGQARTFPWGDSPPDCGTASYARQAYGVIGAGVLCPGIGPEPIGSHPASPDCEQTGDVSRDGVLDLAGSMTEATRDRALRWCWRGIGTDPVCETPATAEHTG